MTAICDTQSLRTLIGEPRSESLEKGSASLDKYARLFLSLSPFVWVGTTSREGKADVSPRGDPPGFVNVVDDRRLLIPERTGNRRADTMQNLIDNPAIGIVAFVPGVEESLRINGRADVVDDVDLLAATAIRGKVPLVGILVHVEEVYFHCGKAVIRSDLWGGRYQIERSAFPRLAQILRDQNWGDDIDVIQRDIDDSYINRLY